jgi:hypothetical protein
MREQAALIWALVKKKNGDEVLNVHQSKLHFDRGGKA